MPIQPLALSVLASNSVPVGALIPRPAQIPSSTQEACCGKPLRFRFSVVRLFAIDRLDHLQVPSTFFAKILQSVPDLPPQHPLIPTDQILIDDRKILCRTPGKLIFRSIVSACDLFSFGCGQTTLARTTSRAFWPASIQGASRAQIPPSAAFGVRQRAHRLHARPQSGCSRPHAVLH